MRFGSHICLGVCVCGPLPLGLATAHNGNGCLVGAGWRIAIRHARKFKHKRPHYGCKSRAHSWEIQRSPECKRERGRESNRDGAKPSLSATLQAQTRTHTHIHTFIPATLCQSNAPAAYAKLVNIFMHTYKQCHCYCC